MSDMEYTDKVSVADKAEVNEKPKVDEKVVDEKPKGGSKKVGLSDEGVFNGPCKVCGERIKSGVIKSGKVKCSSCGKNV